MSRKLDIAMAALAALVTVCAFGESDDAAVANRKWVREAINTALGKRTLRANVTTNANGTVTYSSRIYNAECPGVTSICFTVSMNTNPAVRIVNETIPRIGTSANYAKNALGSYVNVSNSYITSVSVQSGYSYNVTTNTYAWAPTNYFYVTSNRVYRSRFTATATDGTLYESYRADNGKYYLRAVTNAAWRARIFKTGCSDAERNALIGTPLAKTGRRFSVFDLLFSSAYADTGTGGGDTQQITDDGKINWSFTISNFTIIKGDEPFIIQGPFEFSFEGELPEKPSDKHEHDLDSDCNCKSYKTTYEQAEEDSAYTTDANSDVMPDGNMSFSDWMSADEWKNGGGTIKAGQEEDLKKWKLETSETSGGTVYINANDIVNCDAFQKALEKYKGEVEKYLKECQENYKKSQVCEEAGPHHEKEKCGSTDVCTRDRNHLGPHEVKASSYSSTTHFCKCGRMGWSHNIQEGTKNAKSGNTGWTRTDKCTDCNWPGKTIDHTCKHKDCKACSAGYGCNWPCPTCNGNHNWEAKTSSQCAYCKCDNCEQTAPSELTYHAFTGACSHDDPDNDVADVGKHCPCECGWWSCKGDKEHSFNSIDPYEYEKLKAANGEDDPVNHLEKTLKCEYCNKYYGKNKPHVYGEEGSEDDNSYYEKIGTDPDSKCAQVRICSKVGCEYEKHDTAEEAGEHSENAEETIYSYESDDEDAGCKKNMTCENLGKGGTAHTYYELTSHEHTQNPNVTKYEYVDDGDTGCKPFKTCDNCEHEVAKECVAHALEENPSKYNNGGDYDGAGGGCIPVKVCNNHTGNKGCGHEFEQTAQAHVADRTTSGKCKCTNCKTYQCEHQYSADLCGNNKCVCGEYEKPESERTHSGYTTQSGSHVCKCGSKSHAPNWGDWVEVSRANGKINWKRTCKDCPISEPKQTNEDETPNECTEETHIPLPDACGCQCGYYTPGANVSLSNCGRTVGQASTEDNFHKWAGTPVVNGYEPCNCKCGTKHKFREWTASMKNALTYNTSDFCPVCAYCLDKGRDNVGVKPENHKPRDKAYQDGNGRATGATKCGCKCGKYHNGNAPLAKFHPKHPQTCRCYGSTGNGDGEWHHGNCCSHGNLARNDCTSICSYKSANGKSHLANKGTEPVHQATDVEATSGNHTRVTSGCGCKCHEFYGDTLTAAMESLHNDKGEYLCGCTCGKRTLPHKYPSGQCGCQCGTIGTPHNYASGECRCYCFKSNMTSPFTSTKGVHNINFGNTPPCPDVCHGPCGQSASTVYKWLSSHTPHNARCGCQCEEHAPSDYSVEKFEEFHSHPNLSKRCWCYNLCAHRFAMPDPDCTSVCSNCLYDVMTGLYNSDDIHTFTTNAVSYCGCECGRKIDKKHRHSETNCYCYAKNSKSVSHTRKEMNHQWVLTSRELIGEEVECEVCGTVSAKYELTYTCKRCGITKTVETFEGCDCNSSAPGECDCKTCTCKYCKAGTGYCTTCWKQCQPGCKARQSKSEDDDSSKDDGNTDGSDDPHLIK